LLSLYTYTLKKICMNNYMSTGKRHYKMIFLFYQDVGIQMNQTLRNGRQTSDALSTVCRTSWKWKILVRAKVRMRTAYTNFCRRRRQNQKMVRKLIAFYFWIVIHSSDAYGKHF
jgi:hypothetical protein